MQGTAALPRDEQKSQVSLTQSFQMISPSILWYSQQLPDKEKFPIIMKAKSLLPCTTEQPQTLLDAVVNLSDTTQLALSLK